MKAWLARSALVFAILAPLGAQASLNSALDGMYANVTEGGFVEGQMRNTMMFGSASLRSPISSITPITIDPPRYSVGCGGIDLHLGSFSFISSDKLTQFIRDVAQNAGPLIFKMALDAMYPQLGAQIAEFQQWAQEMSQWNANSCQVAQSMLEKSGVKDGITSLAQRLKSGDGGTTDASSARDGDRKEPSKSVKEAEASGKRVQALGNYEWNLIKESGIDDSIFTILDGNPQIAKEIIMTMMGTTIVRSGLNINDPVVTLTAPPQPIRFKDFVEPKPNSAGKYVIQKYSCRTPDAANTCVYMANESTDVGFKLSDYETRGIKGYVRQMMLGDPDAENVVTNSGSIGDKIFRCSSSDLGCELTVEQKKFINAVSSVPYIALLLKAQSVPQTAQALLVSFIDPMTNEMALAYGQTLRAVITKIHAGTDREMPPNYQQTLAAIDEDLAAYRMPPERAFELFNTYAKTVDQAVQARATAFNRMTMNKK